MSKLLIVDDEKDITEFAKNFFRKRGINVFTASGGLQALGIIDRERPDLILLDVHMDEMNGIEVLKKLRENNHDAKVIMVTGVEDETVISEAKKWNIQGHIHKPLILEELEKIVLAELNRF